VSTSTLAATGDAKLSLSGEALTRCAITATTIIIFSFRVSRGCDLRHRVADSVVDAVAAA